MRSDDGTVAGGFEASWSTEIANEPACIICDAGSFRNDGVDSKCSACPAKSTSVAGSSVCSCERNTWMDSSSNPLSCVQCLADTFSAAGSTINTCVSCPEAYDAHVLTESYLKIAQMRASNLFNDNKLCLSVDCD
jgi:hypothetical protein